MREEPGGWRLGCHAEDCRELLEGFKQSDGAVKSMGIRAVSEQVGSLVLRGLRRMPAS